MEESRFPAPYQRICKVSRRVHPYKSRADSVSLWYLSDRAGGGTMAEKKQVDNFDSASTSIEKHKGVAIARRAVFAGLGMAAANLALGIIDPSNGAFIASASAATPFDVWIEDQPSSSSYMTQRCYHMVTLGADSNYFVRVKTSLTSNRGGIIMWNTTKTFYASCDGVNVGQVGYIGPDWDTDYSYLEQETSFTLRGAGTWHVWSEEHNFRLDAWVSAYWNFTIEVPYIIISTAGPGGSITPAGTTQVDRGGSQGYTMTPNAGCHIENVYVDGEQKGPKSSFTFDNVVANHRIHVTFGQKANVTFYLMDSDFTEYTVYSVEIPIPIPSGDPDEVIVWPKIRNGDSYCQAAMEGIRNIYRPDGFSIDKAVDAWFVGSPYGSKLTTYEVHGDCEFWALIDVASVAFLSDGVDNNDIVFLKEKIPVGNTYKFPRAAYDAGEIDFNNLDYHFEQRDTDDFFAYFEDEALTRTLSSIYISEPKIYKVYGRNRTTLRTEYAQDSLTIADRDAMAAQGVVWRTKPDKNAPIYDRPFELPDFTGSDVHKVTGSSGTITLPPIGDDGYGHKAYYHAERVSISVPPVIYGDVGDGRWRTFRCDAWITDGSPDGSGKASAVSMLAAPEMVRAVAATGTTSYPIHGQQSNTFSITRDTRRFIRWYEVVNDGVVSH